MKELKYTSFVKA